MLYSPCTSPSHVASPPLPSSPFLLQKTRDEAEDEQAGSGIILKRLGKAPAATAGVKAGDHQGIREMVQKLTQSSHPLAKSMDYLQEDLENMAKEYRWVWGSVRWAVVHSRSVATACTIGGRTWRTCPRSTGVWGEVWGEVWATVVLSGSAMAKSMECGPA